MTADIKEFDAEMQQQKQRARHAAAIETGDWITLKAVSYTHLINKAIRRSGGKTDYWEISNYLPKETRGYVPAFIAANYVMTYYCCLLYTSCSASYWQRWCADAAVRE